MAYKNMVFIKLFVDYLDAIEPLGDAERGRLFTALLQYARTGEAPQLSGNERFLFPMMRTQIDRDKTEYQEYCEKQAENGRKGGRPKNPKNPVFFLETKKSQEEDKDKDKDKDYLYEEDKEDNSPAPQSATGPPPVCLIPLNTEEEYPVTAEQAEEWAKLYPAVDVFQQLNAMRGWCLANPDKRKTRRDVLRFINSWLTREQDKGRPRPPMYKGRRAVEDHGERSFDVEEIRMLMEENSGV